MGCLFLKLCPIDGQYFWVSLIQCMLLFAAISENEINHFSINLRETDSSRRLSRLPLIMKYGAKFRHVICYSSFSFTSSYFISNSFLLVFLFISSGTEASFMAIDSLDDLQLQITLFLRKVGFSISSDTQTIFPTFPCMASLSLIYIVIRYLLLISYVLFYRFAF